MIKTFLLLPIIMLIIFSCNQDKTAAPENNKVFIDSVKIFLTQYNAEFQDLYTKSAEFQWTLQTHIVEDDTTAQFNANTADKIFAEFTGSEENIATCKRFLSKKNLLDSLDVRQLEAILFTAGNNPAIAGEVVEKRIAATNKQTDLLYGYKYIIDGKQVTPNNIDNILQTSDKVETRLKAWTASKEIGKTLKGGLASLQQLRNESVKPLGYSDFFNYQVSEYGMTSDEMIALTHSMISDSWLLYRELHTWARYELATKYNQPVPEYIPAEWLPNRWGQDWTALVKVEGLDIDSVLKTHDAEWIGRKGEEFYKSIGLGPLPATFWEKSSLYPVEPGAGYSKNNHASAWHMNLDNDVRSLMSVETNTEWWSTVLHELGHIYYYQQYSNADVPLILRAGANRGYHEAFGTMMGLASLQKPFLEGLAMIRPGVKTNDTLKLLSEALDYIVHIPWGSGVMTEFEYNLYAKNLPVNEYNKLWWELVKKYQGIVPPTERSDTAGYCDAATKTHINDDAAQYYDYSISNVLLFQFHTYIAENILHQDPHATNYWGNKGVGEFLTKVMRPGASVDWREHLRASIGSDMSAKPMVDYFAPLMDYLKKVNQGRTYSLPERAPV